MNIVFRELNEARHFRQCIDLQKQIFGLNEVDIVSPFVLSFLINRDPRVGIVLGAFDLEEGKDKLVGFFINLATFEKGSIYGMAIGISPQYQNRNIGLGLFKKLREVAFENGIESFFGVYEPLEGNLANVYFNKIGFLGIKYERSVFELAECDNSQLKIPNDRIMIRWDLYSERVKRKIAENYQKIHFKEALSRFPVITKNNFQDNNYDAVLMEIPEDFLAMRESNVKEAFRLRQNTREIFDEYINNRGFWITEFYSEKTEDGRRNYYLLEKQEGI